MAKTYTESDLQFTFPTDWGVRAYDEHRFYKKMSGLGLKGVDFLLIDPTGAGHLYLVEVKNYRTRTRDGKRYPARMKSAAELAAVVAAKYAHTQRALRAVNVYYRRKWWYRLLEKYLTRGRRLNGDLVFWTRARALAADPEKHTLTVYVDIEGDGNAYCRELESLLTTLLPPRTNCRITNKL